MKRSARISTTIALLLIAATLGIIPQQSAQADTNPATALLESLCEVHSDSSSGMVAGVTAMGPGQTFDVRSTVLLDTGTVYQDVVARPDGSTYFASVIELEPPTGTDVTLDLSTATLTIDGNVEPLTPGTQPAPSGFVIDNSGGRLRVYFPGDSVAMLANVAGVGMPSTTVAHDDTPFVLSATASVGLGSAVTAGAVFDAGTCRASISTGPSARTTGDKVVQIGITEPNISITKAVAPTTVASGGQVTYTITITNPATTPETPTGPAFDVAVLDQLPPELSPVTSSGAALPDGATASSGLRWDAASHTMSMSIPRIDPGTTTTLTVAARLSPTAPAASQFENHVSAVATSVAGTTNDRIYPAVTASAVLNSAAASPTMTKVADRTSAIEGGVINYTVSVALPANSAYENVTFVDVLPERVEYQGDLQATCDTCVTNITGLDLGSDHPTSTTTRIGMYLGSVQTGLDPATLEFHYSVTVEDGFKKGNPIPEGFVFTNFAEFKANIVDHLGGVPPRLDSLRPSDFDLHESTSVVLATPVLSIAKRAISPSPFDPGSGEIEWEVTLTNSGSVDAQNVLVIDDEADADATLNTNQLTLLSPAQDFYMWSYNQIGVNSVPAHGSFTFRYRTGWRDPWELVASPVDYSVTNHVWVQSFEDPFGAQVPKRTSIEAAATVELLSPDLEVRKELVSDAVVAVGTPLTYRVTMINHGLGTASNVAINDELPGDMGPTTMGTATPAGAVDCAGYNSIQCTLTPDRIAPGQTVTFEYQVATDSSRTGEHTNHLSVTYTDGANRPGRTTPTGTVDYRSDAQVTGTLVDPQLTFAKTPELDDPGATIQVNGSANFYLVGTNTGNYTAVNVVIDDPLPEHLSADLASSTCVVWPVLPSSGCSIGGTPASPTFTVASLAPGAEMRVQLAVRHDGADPGNAGAEVTNVATLSATGFQTISDDGGLTIESSIRPPVPTKTVSPTHAGPGDIVTYTVDVEFRNAAGVMHDATLIDAVPDGLTAVTPVSISCLTASCPSTLSYIGFEASPDGGGRAAWFLGDQPMLTAGTVRIVYTAQVASTFVGGGVPTDGTPVMDKTPMGDPLRNAARVWFNFDVDRFSSAPLDVPGTDTSIFTNRSVNARASLDILTPALTLTKTAQHSEVEAGDRSNPLSVNTYTLTIANAGGAPAYAVDLTETMADGELRDVIFGTLPAGVTIVDGWSIADPTTTLSIDEVPAGASIVITYTAVPKPTAEVTASRYVLRNKARILGFHSTPAGAGAGDYLYPGPSGASTDTYVYTPEPHLALSGCSDPDQVGEIRTFQAEVSNWNYLGNPDRTGVGTLRDGVLTVTLDSNVEFITGSVVAIVGSNPSAPYRDPDQLTANPGGTTTMVWNIGGVEMTGLTTLTLRWNVRATSIAVSGPSAVLSGTDGSGAPTRGSAVAATTPYQSVTDAGCYVHYYINKSPDGGVYKAGSDVIWSGVFTMTNPLHHQSLVSGSLIDVLPKGFIYTAGSATFSDGISAAAHNEVITPQPDGTTRIEWSGFTLNSTATSSTSIGVTIPTRADSESVLSADGPLPRDFTNVLGFNATTPIPVGGGCLPGLTYGICDTAWVTVTSNSEPTIKKTVDHPKGPWGDTATFTIDIEVPKNYSSAGLFLLDDTNIANPNVPYWNSSQPSLAYSSVSASCVAGCIAGGADDISVTALGPTPTAEALKTAWKTGPIASDTEARTLRIVYSVTTPTPTDLMGMPGCESVGYLLTTARSCGRAVFVNYAAVWSAWSSLDALNGNWANQWQAYSYSWIGEARATFETSVPQLKIAKRCSKPGEPFDGTGTTSNDSTPIDSSALGTANLKCEVSVRNLGPGPAYYVRYEDHPSPSSAWGTPLTWELRSQWASPGGLVDGSPTNGSMISWEVPELAEGATYTGGFEARASLPSWVTGIRFDQRPNFGAVFSNQARLNSFDLDDFGSITMTRPGGLETTSAWLDMLGPRLNLAKQVNAEGAADPASLATEADCAYWKQMKVGANLACFGGSDIPVYLAEDGPLDYHINIGVASADELRTVNVTDRIPLGWSLVPGSVRLDHASWNASGELITTSTPLFPPTISPTPYSVCDTWTAEGQGDSLSWVFSKAGTGQEAALWNPALRWTGETAGEHIYDATYRISYRLEPNAMWDSCKPAEVSSWSPGVRFSNEVTMAVTTTGDDSAATGTRAQTEMLLPPTFTKNPKDGTTTAPATANFTLDVDMNQRFVIEDATITDTVYDWSPVAGAPTYEPGTATLVDEFGDPVPFVENVTHRSTGPTDPTTIVWTFDTRKAYYTWDDPRTSASDVCPVNVNPSSPNWSNCAARVHVTLPISIPQDEADGYVYNNSATLTLPDRTYDPTDSDYDGIPPFNYAYSLTDTGSIAVTNAFPAPPARKYGPSVVTPGDFADYFVQIDIPAGQAFNDLAYTDVVPDGLEVISVTDKRCALPTQLPCPSFERSTLGPVVNADGTTTVGEFYGDLGGLDVDRSIFFMVHTRVKEQYIDGTRVVAGDALTDTVTGYSNKLNLIDSTPSAPVTSGYFQSEPVNYTTIVEEPILEIEKTADREGPLAAGDQVNYSITVRNVSNVAAFRVPVEDRPNAALTNVQLTGDTSLATKGWTTDEPTLAWQIPVLYPYWEYRFTYTATVGPDPQPVPAIINTADIGVFQAQAIDSPTNREYDGPSDTVTLRFLSANIELTKVPNPTESDPCPTNDPDDDTQLTTVGHSTPWCLTVRNAGELTAGLVVARDMLPSGWTYDMGTATVDGQPAAPTISTLFGLSVLRWDLGDMDAQTEHVIRYHATPGARTPDTSVNTAWATAQRPDGSAPPAGAPGFRATDVASAQLAAVGVEISKTPDRQVLPFIPGGGRATWDINVTNPGQTDLTGLDVTDHFPAGVVYDPTVTTSTCPNSVETAAPAGAAGDQFVHWKFPLLVPDQACSIHVEAVVPSGLTGQTTIINDAQVVTDQTATTTANQAKLVAYKPVTLGDIVWNDLDGDGLYEEGEPGIEGVLIVVSGSDIEGNPYYQTATTDSEGKWTILAPPGKYTITADDSLLPTAAEATLAHVGTDATIDSNADSSGLIGTFTFASGDSDLTLDVGLVLYDGSISGVRWHDLNADGIRQDDEPFIEGEVVTITGHDIFGHAGTLTATTDANGYYEFLGLPPVVFTLSFAEASGLTLSPTNHGTDETVDSDTDSTTGEYSGFLHSSEHLTNLDEGTYRLATVTGLAWNDTDGDGIREAGETPRAGVQVTLSGTDGAGNPVSRVATTDSNGDVTFSSVVPGNYTLTYASSNTAVFTAVDSGSDNTVDSDVNRTTGTAGSFAVTSGANVNGGDAGYVAPVTIDGLVWNDADGDGIRDTTESLTPGVSVTLIGTDVAGHSVSINATTGADGSYSFTGLLPGTYHLEFTSPEGAVWTVDGRGTSTTGSDVDPTTGDTTSSVLSAGDAVHHLDAGYYIPAAVGDFVWQDLNGNGVQDSGEPGISGVKVTVTGTDGAGNSVNTSATTDGNGAWTVDGLAPGTYTVTFGAPTGMVFTSTGHGTATTDSDPAADGTTSVTLASGDVTRTVDAGLYLPGAITGIIWLDSNNDGVRDTAELLEEGVTVQLTGTDGAGNPITLTATTDEFGVYNFTDLPPGNYSVSVVVPSGLTLTTGGLGTDRTKDSDFNPTTSTHTVQVVSGGTSHVDGGLVLGATIEGRVWTDANNDGIHDEAETGRGGVTVTVTGTDQSGNPVIRTTTTAPDGSWSVTVPPGSYSTSFGVPQGAQVVAQHASGSTSANDSDAVPSTGTTAVITVASGDVVSHVDMGLFVPASISGLAWVDTDRDGLHDSSEPLLASVVVELLDFTNSADGVVVARMTTGADGSYSFTGLMPGKYRVRAVGPRHYKPTAQGAGSDDTLDSDMDVELFWSGVINLTPGENVQHVDAGFWAPTSLKLVKSVIGGPTADRVVTYRLRVSNIGERGTMDVITVTDSLPTGLTATSVDGAGWTCTRMLTSVACASTAALEPGEFHDITLVGTIDPSVDGPIVNHAQLTVRDSGDDQVPADNESAAEVRVLGAEQRPNPLPSQLAFTGSNFLLLLMLGGASTAAGGALRAAARRRQAKRVS